MTEGKDAVKVSGKCRECGSEQLRATVLEGGFAWNDKKGMGIHLSGLVYCRKCDKIQSTHDFWGEMGESGFKNFLRKAGLCA